MPYNSLDLYNHSLLLGPAERADIILDFTGYQGKKLILYNDANSPFPDGDPVVPGIPGFGPDASEILLLQVVPPTGEADLPLTITTATNLRPGNDPLIYPPQNGKILPGKAADIE